MPAASVASRVTKTMRQSSARSPNARTVGTSECSHRSTPRSTATDSVASGTGARPSTTNCPLVLLGVSTTRARSPALAKARAIACAKSSSASATISHGPRNRASAAAGRGLSFHEGSDVQSLIDAMRVIAGRAAAVAAVDASCAIGCPGSIQYRSRSNGYVGRRRRLRAPVPMNRSRAIAAPAVHKRPAAARANEVSSIVSLAWRSAAIAATGFGSCRRAYEVSVWPGPSSRVTAGPSSRAQRRPASKRTVPRR